MNPLFRHRIIREHPPPPVPASRISRVSFPPLLLCLSRFIRRCALLCSGRKRHPTPEFPHPPLPPLSPCYRRYLLCCRCLFSSATAPVYITQPSLSLPPSPPSFSFTSDPPLLFLRQPFRLIFYLFFSFVSYSRVPLDQYVLPSD
ncbi:hypothetical protein FA13DRAFT_1385776 [Coprinellus micaceus]|uniref:Uncharacterized protein n=1 Tax=Coprinellus micaceus TaxID=71717 RepID=A0A4Y7TNM3_COPMI|nr:hypothetical protein FA13DRAFT_1385776 [Coprinellus micaceus]